jgi:hypothetical protein
VQAQESAGAFILEADGALTDLHMDGHRVAFNRWVLCSSCSSAQGLHGRG